MWQASEYRCLPETGGLYDQPAVLMEALAICRRELDKYYENERREKERTQKMKESMGSNTTGPRRH